MRLDDRLGHLVPPGRVRRPQLEHGLRTAMEQRRLTAAHGVPSFPTRYVVAMHPADLAWLDPTLPDLLTRSMTRYAEHAGVLEVGDISVEFEADKRLEPGRPQFWAGFAQDDLLVLANVDAPADVLATAR